MSLTMFELGPAALEVIVAGRLGTADYETFIPEVERRIRDHGKVGLLLNVSGFRGWSPGALWEDLKFEMKHYRDVSRLALVADNPNKQWLAAMAKPFTAAEVKFFPIVAHETAREWVLN
ncbi:MAG: STAS/SEC14 domain-containing protein [Lysobacterales bacterium]|jgi:hypothetical protein